MPQINFYTRQKKKKNYCGKFLGVNQCCSIFAAFRVFLNITSFILFHYRLKVNYEIPVPKSINYRIWIAIYFLCHIFTHAYICKTINKTFIHIIHDEQYLS